MEEKEKLFKEVLDKLAALFSAKDAVEMQDAANQLRILYDLLPFNHRLIPPFHRDAFFSQLTLHVQYAQLGHDTKSSRAILSQDMGLIAAGLELPYAINYGANLHPR